MKFLKKIFTKNFFILIILIIIGAWLRIGHLQQNNITFGYDQARDAYVASEIIHGDIKILGPPVSLGGFYHGVLYYYFIALPYFISQGNPILPIIFISLLNLSAIPFVYFIGKILFNKKVGLLSALFYTISFDIIQYSNWLSNPSLAVPFSVLLYFGLVLTFFTSKKTWGTILTAIGYAFSFQSQFFLGYLIIPIAFCLYFFRTKLSKKQITIFIILTLVLLGTMILSYFKFGFTFIDGFKSLFSNDNQFGSRDIDYFISLKLILVRLVENFYRSIFPFNSLYTAIFVFLCFIFSIKQIKGKTKLAKPLIFLWFFIFSQAIIIPFGGNSTPHINVGLQLPALIISSVILYDFSKKKKFLSLVFLLIIITSSLKTDLKFNPQGQILFAQQKSLTLRNEIDVVEYTYQSSSNQPFSVNTISSPFWINTLWSYIYNWYGQNKYHYLPSFHGRDQVGRLGSLPIISGQEKFFYLIIEPDIDIYPTMITDAIQYEDSFSKIIETKNINRILVQKRELIKPFNEIKFVK